MHQLVPGVDAPYISSPNETGVWINFELSTEKKKEKLFPPLFSSGVLWCCVIEEAVWKVQLSWWDYSLPVFSCFFRYLEYGVLCSLVWFWMKLLLWNSFLISAVLYVVSLVLLISTPYIHIITFSPVSRRDAPKSNQIIFSIVGNCG